MFFYFYISGQEWSCNSEVRDLSVQCLFVAFVCHAYIRAKNYGKFLEINRKYEFKVLAM